jgi:hypothetical protein
MRRALTGLAAAAVTALAVAGPASPASAQTVRNFGTSRAATAMAVWGTSSATSFAETTVVVSKSRQGSELFIDQFTGKSDANGNFTYTDTLADVTSGFSFAIDQKLTTASLSGSGLPGSTCTFDANGNQIGCSATTIDAAADWTGQGPISRSQFTFHGSKPGFNELIRDRGTMRDATATGTVDGLTLPTSDLASASIGTDDSVDLAICIGKTC